MDGLIFNVQRFSIHDGPGIRTTVFLKGCTLRCFWCHNPESIRLRPDLQFYPERCIGCGRCVAACPRQAHLIEDGHHRLLRERCDDCGRCAAECYSQALTLAGRRVSSDAVVAEVLRDAEFYRATGGGVTLSGGEPALQPEFSRAILADCHAHGLHTVVETAASCPWKDLALVLGETDLVLLDLKLMDSARHRAAVGSGNERILANVRRMDALGIPIVPRVPVVPGVNDTPEDVAAIARLVAELRHARELVLLPFHQLGEGKYRSLGIEYRARHLRPPSAETMRTLADRAGEIGVAARVG